MNQNQIEIVVALDATDYVRLEKTAFSLKKTPSDAASLFLSEWVDATRPDGGEERRAR